MANGRGMGPDGPPAEPIKLELVEELYEMLYHFRKNHRVLFGRLTRSRRT